MPVEAEQLRRAESAVGAQLPELGGHLLQQRREGGSRADVHGCREHIDSAGRCLGGGAAEAVHERNTDDDVAAAGPAGEHNGLCGQQEIEG